MTGIEPMSQKKNYTSMTQTPGLEHEHRHVFELHLLAENVLQIRSKGRFPDRHIIAMIT